MCAAPKGNQFWKLRSKHGRDKIFNTPELLWKAACEYFDWCDNHPITKETVYTTSDSSTIKQTIVDRPYTIQGLCVYCGTHTQYFDEFKRRLDPENSKIEKDFSVVLKEIENIIYNNKFEGASIGKFNANIIARDLGLKDKSDIDHTTNGDKIENKTVIHLSLEERIKQIDDSDDN